MNCPYASCQLDPLAFGENSKRGLTSRSRERERKIKRGSLCWGAPL